MSIRFLNRSAAGLAALAVVLLAILVVLPAPSSAQAGGTQAGSAQTAPPAADPADVESVDAIIAALYDVISGPKGEARDWDRFRSLFHPQAQLAVTGRNPQTGQGGVRYMSIEDYITGPGPNLEASGFFERELHRVTARFGDIVHAFSTYDSRRNADDAEPFARGINSIQLRYDGSRWYYINIFWQGESPAFPIPAKYLGG